SMSAAVGVDSPPRANGDDRQIAIEATAPKSRLPRDIRDTRVGLTAKIQGGVSGPHRERAMSARVHVIGTLSGAQPFPAFAWLGSIAMRHTGAHGAALVAGATRPP